MESAGHRNLSGYWTGLYEYPDGVDAPVGFTAVLTEAEGALGGEIVEPDTMCGDGQGDLFATVFGARMGAEVSFDKRYEARRGAGHSVRYEGRVNRRFTMIQGIWRVDWMTGRFVMSRPGAAKRVRLRQIAEVG